MVACYLVILHWLHPFIYDVSTLTYSQIVQRYLVRGSLQLLTLAMHDGCIYLYMAVQCDESYLYSISRLSISIIYRIVVLHQWCVYLRTCIGSEVLTTLCGQ